MLNAVLEQISVIRMIGQLHWKFNIQLEGVSHSSKDRAMSGRHWKLVPLADNLHSVSLTE